MSIEICSMAIRLFNDTHILYFGEGVHDVCPNTELMVQRLYEKFPELFG